jgi:DNA ligase (NAD+)
MAAEPDEIAAVDGVGEVIASTVHEWFRQPANQAFVEKLRAAEVDLGDPERAAAAAAASAATPRTLEGRAVVVSGTLAGYTREEAVEAIVRRGGTSPGSVSGKTYALVVGESPGASKLAKAEAADVPVLDAAGFAHLLETGELPAG